ncbi:MAG: FixH family protein [Flavobacteriaceae bacterium]|jgi:hypothetical protein|nr:FixH family protein [Flavobacteriaceae bacterium]
MKFKFTWGHGVIAALACFIIFICYMIFSVEFSKNSFDLVTDDYYEDGLDFQQEIDASKNVSALLEKPLISIEKGEGIKVTFPKEFTSANTQGKYVLYRPNKKELDVKKNSLDFSPENDIFIPAKVLVQGHYTMKLYWEKDKIHYQMEENVVWN